MLRISGKSLLISAAGCGIVGIISKSDRQPMLRRPQPPRSIETQRVLRPNAGAGASLRRAASYVQASQERSQQLSVQGCCKCRVGDNAVANARVTATSAAASPNRVCDSAPNARALRQLPKGRRRADHENVICAAVRPVLFYTGSAGRRFAENKGRTDDDVQSSRHDANVARWAVEQRRDASGIVGCSTRSGCATNR